MTTGQATVDQVAANVLLLPREEKKAPRAYLVGATETGKSTLMEVLANEYRKAYSLPKLPVMTLILDSKPRFRAERELYGLFTAASRRYAKWGYGSGIIPGSVVCDGKMPWKYEFSQAFKTNGVHTIIVQTEHESERPRLAEAARAFYEGYGAKKPRLVIVDEVADFYESGRAVASIIQQIARAGRERDVALIAGSQRPRKVPKELMTEMSRLYLFELQWVRGANSDLRHIMEFGLPPELELTAYQPAGHVFFMWDRKLKYSFPSGAYHQLDLSSNFYTGAPYGG